MKRIFLSLAAVKVAYLALLMGALALWPDYDETRASAIREGWFPPTEARWLEGQQTGFTRFFTTWDAAHYLVLSKAGYFKGLRAVAFYPLWPLTVRWVSDATGVGRVITGMVLANLFSLAGWTLFWSITRKRFGESAAKWALVFLVIFPGSLFCQFIYTEPLFFLLAMLLWFGMENSRYRLAWVAACLLPLTRAVGVFALLPIVWHGLERLKEAWSADSLVRGLQGEISRNSSSRFEPQNRAGGTPSIARPAAVDSPSDRAMLGAPVPGKISPKSSSRFEPTRRERGGRVQGAVSRGQGWLHSKTWRQCAGPVLLLTAPLAGWAVYFGLMWHWTGNAFQGFTAQAVWQAHSINNLWDLPKFVMGFFEPTSWHEFRGSVLDRCGFMLVLYSVPVLWRTGKDLLVWLFILAIIPAMSGTFISFIRFESAAFPIFVALGVFAARQDKRWLPGALVAGMAALHLVLLWRFVNYGWAG